MAAVGGWSGFTDEELAKIKQKDTYEQETQSTSTSKKTVTFKKQPKKKKPLNSSVHPPPSDSDDTRMPQQCLPDNLLPSAKLQEKKLDPKLANGMITLKVKEDGHSFELLEQQKKNKNVVEAPGFKENEEEESLTVNLRDIDDHLPSIDLTTLEKFEQRQKMIKEQNLRRRAMLAKAIAERKKKTKEEVEKLTFIQAELAKLDSLLSNDVAILRDHIEHASMEFTESQKRYDKAEKEYVEAKLELFQRMERKEQLTEHLCMIIEQNELRKAQKLAELMDQLELDCIVEDFEDAGFDLFLPQLCAMNDLTSTFGSTIKEPKSPSSPVPAGDDEQPKTSKIVIKQSETPVVTVQENNPQPVHNNEQVINPPTLLSLQESHNTLIQPVSETELNKPKEEQSVSNGLSEASTNGKPSSLDAEE